MGIGNSMINTNAPVLAKPFGPNELREVLGKMLAAKSGQVSA